MKKQDAFASKLSFSKEKVASLTPDDLGQVHGGSGTNDSTNSSTQSSAGRFTCCFCTTVLVEEAN
jgi:hypothetical protein